MEKVDETPAWPERAWALAALGGAIGLAIHGLTDVPDRYRMTDDAVRLAAATFLGMAGIAFALTLERVRASWSAGFAVLAGLVVASAIYWNGGPGRWDANDGWRFFCGVLAIGIAAPLFQTMRDEGRRTLPYRVVHSHAWNNVVLGGLALIFVGVTWLLAFLLSELFQLIGIKLLRDLINKEWFGWMLSGVALGAAIGLLRDQDRIVHMFQRVVIVVLSVLAPVLGAGLVIFLIATIFTGLKPLWEATRETTPILLSCFAGAFILANDVIGDGPEDEAKNPLLRWAGVALAAVMLPLAAIAAISTGLRLDQYGLTPSRLWALTFIIVTCAIGVAYWVALIRRRLNWADAARPANIRLAIGLCALMLLLSTPLVNFGTLSVRSQVVRLEAGKLKPERFDWAALAFDFGPQGRKAVERLAKSPNATIRAEAVKALAAKDRWELAGRDRHPDADAVFAERVKVVPSPVPLPGQLVAAAVREFRGCGRKDTPSRCIIRYVPGADDAVLVHWWGECDTCRAEPRLMVRTPQGDWARAFDRTEATKPDAAEIAIQRAAAERGEIEVREVKRRQVFVGGKPVGDVFE
ncbi:protein of unknown function [Sphingomonas laterariae]|uniref:DUF4153 domain-containing protein n=1 Tax=Edaphosphingomonas laterariae TaxID=861865 RepID=A0A239EQI4_9SPHN|nr:DUF4153 domain-containing protein [Sphingomonas laterariae]SNS46907.1 protein of unknown function [Sphingomonas laterariae]